MISWHHNFIGLIRLNRIVKRLLIRKKPGAHHSIQERGKFEHLNCDLCHGFVINRRLPELFGKHVLIRGVLDEQTHKSDGEQDRHAWGKKESDPRYGQHVRILIVDLKLRPTVQVLVSKQGFLLGFRLSLFVCYFLHTTAIAAQTFENGSKAEASFLAFHIIVFLEEVWHRYHEVVLNKWHESVEE